MATILNAAGPSADGTTLGATSTAPAGMHGTVCAQASAPTAAVTTTTATVSTLAAEVTVIAGVVNSLRTILINKGICV